MATVGHNDNLEYSKVRDAFFSDGEVEFFDRFMKNPKNVKIHEKIMERSPEKNYAEAMELIAKVEAGLVPEEEMLEVEWKIAHLLSGEDIHIENINELSPDEATTIL